MSQPNIRTTHYDQFDELTVERDAEPAWQRSLRTIADANELFPRIPTRGAPRMPSRKLQSRLRTQERRHVQTAHRQRSAASANGEPGDDQSVLTWDSSVGSVGSAGVTHSKWLSDRSGPSSSGASFTSQSQSQTASRAGSMTDASKVGTIASHGASTDLSTVAQRSMPDMSRLSSRQRRKRGTAAPTKRLVGRLLSPVSQLAGRACRQVAVGEKHMLALDEEGHVWAWGTSLNGRLGYVQHESEVDATAHKVVGIHARVVSIAVGADFSAAVTEDGGLYTWGCGDDGKLGHISYRHGKTAALVWSLNARHSVRKVACGKSHMVTITQAGLAFSSGECSHGRLGLGEGYTVQKRSSRKEQDAAAAAMRTEGTNDPGDMWEPQLIGTLSSMVIVDVACGFAHSMVVTDKGQVFTCGKGISQALGHGVRVDEWLFRQISSLIHIKVRMVSAGALHSAAVTDEGVLYTWGTGVYGRLGHGGKESEGTPRVVEALSAPPRKRVVQIACGRAHTAALVYDTCHAPAGGEALYVFGDDKDGQLGLHDYDGITCNGKKLTRLEKKVRLVKHEPVLVGRIAGMAVKDITASIYMSATAIVAIEPVGEPTLIEWFTRPATEGGLEISMERAAAYVDVCESRGYTSISAFVEEITKGGLRWMLTECIFETSEMNQKKAGDVERIWASLNDDWRRPTPCAGIAMACGKFKFEHKSRATDDYAQALTLAAFDEENFDEEFRGHSSDETGSELSFDTFATPLAPHTAPSITIGGSEAVDIRSDSRGESEDELGARGSGRVPTCHRCGAKLPQNHRRAHCIPVCDGRKRSAPATYEQVQEKEQRERERRQREELSKQAPPAPTPRRRHPQPHNAPPPPRSQRPKDGPPLPPAEAYRQQRERGQVEQDPPPPHHFPCVATEAHTPPSRHPPEPRVVRS